MKHYLLYCVSLFILYSCKKEDVLTEPQGSVTLTDMFNVQYGTNTDTSGNQVPLLLDIYYPTSATTANKYPLVMLVHGGGYVGGDKNGFAASCRVLADSGFIAVSINYRLGWRKGTTSCSGDMNSFQKAIYRGLQDGNAALRFLVSKAKEFAIDTNWIFIGGSSAGANIAMNIKYVTTPVISIFNPSSIAGMGGINNAGNNLSNTFSVKGICHLWGGIMDSTLINAQSATPTISFHGMRDDVAPYDTGHFQRCPNYPFLSGSMSINRQLLRYNKSSVVHLSVNGGHGPDEFTDTFIMSNTVCFFKKIIKNQAINNRVLTGVSNSCQ